MRSIERLLLGWVLGALSIGAVALVLVSYLLTLDELDEVFDENLKQVALASSYHYSLGELPESMVDADDVRAALPELPKGGRRVSAARPSLPRIYESEGAFDFITLVWTEQGELRFTSDASVTIPFSAKTGIQHLKRPDGEWHVYSIVQRGSVVQAAQRESSRDTLAVEVASKMFIPLAALVILIGMLLVMALRRGLRSLDHAAGSVAQRTAATLLPVSLEHMPREIHPLVHAINDLLARLSEAFTTHRRFVADAAHELRTPVTALRLQLQLLERADDADARSAAVRDLKAGVARSQHLIEQLLNLSRFEPDSQDAPAVLLKPVDLGALVRDVVGDMSIKAEHGGIDLGADVAGDIVVKGDHEQLRVLLNNLLENALRHTPAGGVIDVRASVLGERPTLQVIDSGCGIAPGERERVFDRFYRGENTMAGGAQMAGSGLGLAIVRSIADRHHAQVSLHTAPSGSGLEVRVVFVAYRPAP